MPVRSLFSSSFKKIYSLVCASVVVKAYITILYSSLLYWKCILLLCVRFPRIIVSWGTDLCGLNICYPNLNHYTFVSKYSLRGQGLRWHREFPFVIYSAFISFGVISLCLTFGSATLSCTLSINALMTIVRAIVLWVGCCCVRTWNKLLVPNV